MDEEESVAERQSGVWLIEMQRVTRHDLLPELTLEDIIVHLLALAVEFFGDNLLEHVPSRVTQRMGHQRVDLRQLPPLQPVRALHDHGKDR